MASFFEKLKKGMGVEMTSATEAETNNASSEEQPEEQPEEQAKEKAPKEKPVKKAKKQKIKKEEKKEEIKAKEEIEVEIEEEIKAENEDIETEQDDETEVKIEKSEEKKSTPAKTAKNKEKQSIFSKDQEGQLAIDVYQTEELLVLQSAIAGVKPESLDVVIEGDMISIRGMREKPEEKGERNYFYQECFWGPFSRQIILSVDVDPGRAEADLKDGILTIKLPKIERDKKRKLTVMG